LMLMGEKARRSFGIVLAGTDQGAQQSDGPAARRFFGMAHSFLSGTDGAVACAAAMIVGTVAVRFPCCEIGTEGR
jgi:hypothetical protein